MEKDKIYLASTAIELSEEEDKPYIELTNRLCYYGEANLNGVILPVEGAEEKAQTLINMPVQAKYRVGKDGKTPDLGGHEAYIDRDGDLCFATESIGTHISVEIKDDTVEVNGEKKTLPCLFSTSRIWKRNKNIIKAIKSLFDRGLLHSSWEIETKKYSFDKGIKTLVDYEFLGNALLGSTTPGAYPCAVALDMSSLEQSGLELAEAFTIDKEENELAKKKIETEVSEEIEVTIPDESTEEVVAEVAEPTVETPEVTESVTETSETSEETSEEPTTETSALTVHDLRCRIAEACTKAYGAWCYVAFWFPEEHTVWCDYDDKKSDLDFLLFTYEVADDEVTVGEPVPVSLTVSISEVNKVISEKDDALVRANETIKNLENQVSALQPFKDAADKAELEKAEAEKAEKKNNLKAYAMKSGFISEEEISENAEIAEMVESLNEAGIKAIIAERFMASLSGKVETSSVETASAVSVDLNSEEDENNISINPVQAYLN